MLLLKGETRSELRMVIVFCLFFYGYKKPTKNKPWAYFGDDICVKNQGGGGWLIIVILRYLNNNTVKKAFIKQKRNLGTKFGH